MKACCLLAVQHSDTSCPAATSAPAVLLALREGAVVGRSPLTFFGPLGDIHEEQVRGPVCVLLYVVRAGV